MTEETTVLDIDALKQEATELGISFHHKTSAPNLKKLIDEFYSKAEQAAETVTILEDEETQTEAEYRATKATAKEAMRKAARQLEADARKTRVVIIIDNDQRVNSVATSCTVNCSNAYFDLGTIILPLNVEVEVREGHLAALAEVRIPQHIQDPENPSVSRTVLRPRYSIQTVTQFDTK